MCIRDRPNAVIFSRDDLTICGAGWLSVCGDVNDGISSKDGLIIAGGTIDIDVVDDGIRGKDYLVVRGGDILVSAGGDGLKSDNEQDDAKGYVSIEAGALSIVSGADAIQAQTDVMIADGEVTVRSGGGTNRNNNINADMDRMIDDAAAQPDPAERCELYRDIQQKVKDEAIMEFWADPVILYAHSGKLSDVVYYLGGNTPYFYTAKITE